MQPVLMYLRLYWQILNVQVKFNIVFYIKQQFQILTQLPAILKEEEDEAFKNEAGEIETDDIINKQHNSAVRTIAIGHIVEKVNAII